MLSKKEKEEMLVDGQSLKRRKTFMQVVKTADKKEPFLLDSYIRFLMNIQKI